MAEELESVGSDKRRRSGGVSTSDGERSLLFGEIRQRRVAFCIDTSGGMYDCLDAVKSELMVALRERARPSAPTSPRPDSLSLIHI